MSLLTDRDLFKSRYKIVKFWDMEKLFHRYDYLFRDNGNNKVPQSKKKKGSKKLLKRMVCIY